MDQATSDQQEKLSIGETLRLLGAASRGSWLVNLVNFSDGVAYFGLLGLLTLYLQRDVGFTTGTATIAVSLFTAGVTIFQALGGGTVSDRLGVRRALALSLALILVGRILLTLAPAAGASIAVLIAWISILVMAFGEGAIQPALYSGIKEYTDPRAATMGYAVLYAIMNLGIVAGEIVSPLVREWWAERYEGVSVAEVPTAGITGAFWFFILVTAASLVLHMLLFTRKVEERDRVDLGEPEPPVEGGFLTRLKSLPILEPRFLFFILILLPVRTLFAHQWLTMPDYVTRAFPPEIGSRWEWLNGLNPLIIVIFVPLFAGLTRHRKIVDMMIVGTFVSAVSTFLLVPAPRLELLLAYFVVFSLGEALWSSRFLEYVADIAPAGRIGIYMGVATIPWFLAKTVTGFYAGSMLERYVPVGGPHEPGQMWLIYGMVAMISPIALLLARRWLLSAQRHAGTTPAHS